MNNNDQYNLNEQINNANKTVQIILNSDHFTL